jgi:hypothetical protein
VRFSFPNAVVPLFPLEDFLSSQFAMMAFLMHEISYQASKSKQSRRNLATLIGICAEGSFKIRDCHRGKALAWEHS